MSSSFNPADPSVNLSIPYLETGKRSFGCNNTDGMSKFSASVKV